MIAELRPYAEYRDSGVPWLGAVPAHWDSERAKWLFQRMQRPVTASDEVVTCFRDGTVTLRKNRRLAGFTEALKEIGYQGIRRGDLVIHAMDAFAGAIGVSDSDGKCTPVYAVCQPSADVDPHFYAHLVREMARSQWIAALAKGIRERSTDFRFEAFSNQVLPVPPRDEQTQIAHFLDHADRKIRRYIRAKQKLIKLLDEQKQAIIHRAVTRGLDAGVRLKSSGSVWLGAVPEHWEVIRLKRRVGFQEGPGIMAADFRDEGIPLLRISCLRGDSATLNGCNYLDPEMVQRRWGHFRVRAGDYLLSASASTGSVVLATAVVEGAVPYTGILRLWPVSSKTLMPYVRLFMTTRLFQDQVNAAKSGVGIEHFGPTHLKRMMISLPPVEEQARIVEFVDEHTRPFDHAIAATKRDLELVREYRTRLIADVVTGKLDVRAAAAALPAADSDEPDAVSLDEELLDVEEAEEPARELEQVGV